MDIKTIFYDFARAFKKKMDTDYHIRLQFEVHDMENGLWQIEANNGKIAIYNEKKIDPEECFVLSKDTLVKLYNNEIAPITAFANEPDEKGEMRALIELKNKTEEKKIYLDKKPSDEYLEFIERLHKFNDFFSKEYPTKIIVGKGNGRKIHDVNGIGLFSNYKNGIRIIHVYFSIEKGRTLNEPAVEFSIYVLSGKGTITVSNEDYPIEAKNYYHMKPQAAVCIKNNKEESLELLYLANT